MRARAGPIGQIADSAGESLPSEARKSARAGASAARRGAAAGPRTPGRFGRRRALALLAALLLGLPAPLRAAPEQTAGARHSLGAHVSHQYLPNLDEILERGYLRVLTSNNSFDYFIYQGHHAGYQYEMVRAFTAHLNARYKKRRNELKIQFELLPVPSDQLIPMLLAGRGDMIAARLTVTPERSVQVLFSAPYREVDELVVGHSAIADVKFVHDLADRRIAVRRSSSYYASLLEESRRLVAEGKQPIQIETVDPVLETEDILALVAAGRFDFTVADSIVAETAIEIHPELSALRGLELRRGGKLAWATHLTAPALQREMSEFLRGYQHGSLLGNIGIKKYFRDLGAIRARQSGTTASLSDYDAELRRYAGEFGFDWRLMAAVAYQESRFDQGARNRSGAVGLFQIKPTTAREPYVGIADVAGPENASNNIHAGIKYLAWIKGRYFDGVESMRERDRLRMALAAYNAGPKTLINARKRAERMGLDPNRWFRNVELALLAMNKVEPVKYVSEINQHYLSYVMLGIE